MAAAWSTLSSERERWNGDGARETAFDALGRNFVATGHGANQDFSAEWDGIAGKMSRFPVSLPENASAVDDGRGSSTPTNNRNGVWPGKPKQAQW